jgi:hypothetical protein
MHFLEILSFLLFLVILHRSTAGIAEGIIDYSLKFFVLMLACIIPTGFALSTINALNVSWAWFFLINIFAGLILLQTSHKTFTPFDFKKFSWIGWMQQLNLIEKITFSILALAVIITAIANLIIIFNTYPSEWDSMTGHLVKCAFYLQNGNFNRLGGTTWTIDFYPNSLPSIQLFFYHLFGSEAGFKVIHYIAYWVFGLAMFGIARQLSTSTSAAVFVGLVSLLLPTALVQATTTETDLILTAYLATLFYFILRFQKTQNQRTIVIFIALSAAIWMSHKVTFILITPSVFVVAFYFLLIKKAFWKHWVLFFGSLIVFLAIYVLPTGYLGNIKETGKIGGISAPEEVMRWHSNLNYTGKEVAKFGTMNVARYGLDFFNLDGLRNFPFGEKLNDLMRILPEKIARKINLERMDYWVVAPFKLDPTVPFHIERPYWGIVSFLMVLPAIFIVLFVRKFRQKDLFFLLIAGILHCLSLCYTAPYDPIKGRYFMNTTVWFLPFMLVFFNGKKKSIFLLFCSIIIILQAFGTVFKRNLYPLFSSEVHPKSIFQMSRLEQQVSVSRPDIYVAYAKFDSLVPQNAVVALASTNEDFEYPLFGEKLGRKLIPIHPFKAKLKPIPANADFVFITAGVMPIQKGDILLNEVDFDIKNINPVEANKYYLRKLKK